MYIYIRHNSFGYGPIQKCITSKLNYNFSTGAQRHQLDIYLCIYI